MTDYDNTSIAKEYNTNPSLLSSIMAKLSQKDMQLVDMTKLMEDLIKSVKLLFSQKDELENWLSVRMGEIQSDLNGKLIR